jgi:hypothetical protein
MDLLDFRKDWQGKKAARLLGFHSANHFAYTGFFR